MKFIYITCNVSMLETVTALLQNKKIANYQVIEKVAAVSSFDEPRQDTAVWPGYNSALLVQEADEERARELMEAMESMNADAFNRRELIAACMWDVEQPLRILTKPTAKAE